MMNQAKVGLGVGTPLGLRVHSQFRKRELSSLPPELDGGIDLCRPQKVWLLASLGRFRNQCLRSVHVVTTDLVLCTISTVLMVNTGTSTSNTSIH